MRVVVIGSGYVGLVAGACFANVGNKVTMVDIDPAKIEMLKAGEIPIYEPGLQEIVVKNTKNGRLSFTTELSEAIPDAQVVFFAVGTPSEEDGSVNMSYVDAAAEQVAKALTGYAVLVNKSTVPVGTQQRVKDIVTANTTHPFDVVSNPEFLKEGAAVDDFLHPDRVIVGVDSERALQAMTELYAPFMVRSDRLFVMDPPSAELTKYACNAMLAARISFMNELSRICEGVGANVNLVRKGMGSDPRIGPHFLYASLGYGGSCFPKDVAALADLGKQLELPLKVVTATQQANLDQRDHFVNRVLAHTGDLTGKSVMVWGLAFKAKTDDVRESAALVVVEKLLERGAVVSVHDPKAMSTSKEQLGDRVTWCEDPYDGVDGAHALIVCTEWSDYRVLDLPRLEEQMESPLICDGRNLYRPEIFKGTPFTYVSIGRPVVKP